MKKLLAGLALLMTTSVTGSFGVVGNAWADDAPPPVPPPGGPAAPTPSNPGTAFALGGAHVLGIPYDEYIRMTGEHWFPGMKRTKVDYPAGQVQGHTLERLFPGIGAVGERFYPGIGLDGPSIGESVDEGEGNLDAAIRNGGKGTAMGLSEGALVLNAVKARLANDPSAPPPDQLSFATFGDPIAKHPFGESFLTQNFPVGSVVPFMDYRIPAPVESQYHTDQFISAYDSIADWPDRPDNWMSVINAIAGLATGHTAIAFTNPSNVPPQNIRTTVNSKGATTTTYLVPEEHLPLVLPFKYLGYDQHTLNELDRVLLPMVDAGYSRNDDPATAPVTVDPVHGFDPAEVTAPANEATFGGGTDPMSELANAALSVLNPNGAG
ncbi:PE-PPE domain-containing protein [Mycolicibacterium sp. (ex Dasyatis americana)]|uniref:PE-PPE domain-containing protein n=1 Tax=Mycobacterium syngnathidarum TaxID=1908205 RepID=A0A1Q9WF38_9MYCO|nr:MULTISPECIES: acyltransferase PE [Mycobacterium]OFB35640.1 PE-PPE domain-containing protein [Mycolicibacterium sp. (ex Dasyatis americana)]MCG7607935.1 PE-PPE domain-containing protein [Mycobacterium sp. CnD-18-1]OHU00896.1 PE-PPE domain-containing protein [Mycobacterium syngnathidarum]OLT97427.1 PE-PPE domain-containing protein [Mycobacterium syngnathidarum]TMS50855.1 PE-PPE domain-containing protein [Mycobacterium sp. DBP42]